MMSSLNIPRGVSILPGYLFVDDIPNSASNIMAAQELIYDIINMLKACGCLMRKWLCNELEVLALLSDELKESNLNPEPKNAKCVKLLGNHRNFTENYLIFHI